MLPCLSRFLFNKYNFLMAIRERLPALFTIALLAALACGCSNQQQTSLQQPPNMLVIIADDISHDDFGCYGNQAVQTPRIDQLASNGLRFDNAYLTTSSCSPSRCSIISGRYPHNTGAPELHTPLPEGVPVFPEILQQQGYYTAASGKWHMGEAPRTAFDTIVTDMALVGDGGEEAWRDLVAERPKDKPFFMWFAAYDAHRDWGPNSFSGTHNPGDVTVPPYLVDADSTRADLARYYDEIKRFDHYIGEVVDELEQQNALDNTIIIVMADNGRPFPRCKTRVYDSGMKTPFVVHWPAGITKPGSTPDALLSVIDIAPTLLQLAGAAPGSSFQGKSFAQLLKEPDQPFRDYVFAEHNWHDYEALERMVRGKDFMYVLNERAQLPNQGPADSNRSLSFLDLLEKKEQGELTAAQAEIFAAPRPVEELFDCTSDSLQLLNLASVAAQQNKLRQLRQVMEEWRRQTLDNTPENLTPDKYHRQTGANLGQGMQPERGEMPGEATGAVKTGNSGPF